MFVLMILEKTKEAQFTPFQGTVTVLKKMANYEEVRVKVANNQLKKLESEGKHKTGTE